MRIHFKTFIQTVFYFFFLFCVLFIPVTLKLFSFQETFTQFFFSDAIQWIAKGFFGEGLKNPAISSDATSLYILVLLLFILSLLAGFLLPANDKWKEKKYEAFAFMQVVFCYYLSLQLFLYGFDKIFKAQFYLPEPNILYTAFGKISRDLLYWSTIGTSYSYNIFLGAIEVIAAVMLICKRARMLGLLLGAAIMLHVVAVNFSFDISVKLYATFLFLLAVFLLSPQIGRLYRFLVLQEAVQLKMQPLLPAFLQQSFIKTALKTFVVGVIFFQALYPRLQAGGLNDNQAERFYMHGAYEVQEALSTETAIAVPSPVKRIFIHRNGYIIFENADGKMQDFKFIPDSLSHRLVLLDNKNDSFNLVYQYSENFLQLHYLINNKQYLLKAKALNWKNLPALQNHFHWTVDEL